MRRWPLKRAASAAEQAAPCEEAPQAVHVDDGSGNGQLQLQPEVVAATTSPASAQGLAPATPIALSESARAKELSSAPAPSSIGATAQQPSVARSLPGWLWRSRGLFLGALALGIAFNAQRVLTADHAVIPSIRW